MSWKDLFRRKDEARPRADIVLEALQRHSAAGKIHLVELVPGKIGGEGTYKLMVDSGYSRSNLTALGLSDSQMTRRAGGIHGASIIEVAQQPLEEALTSKLGVVFPPVRGYTG